MPQCSPSSSPRSGPRFSTRSSWQTSGMPTHDIRKEERDSLARFLGWFSIGLGIAELAAPRVIGKVIGGGNTRFIRLMGLRELGHGGGILTRTRPTKFV